MCSARRRMNAREHQLFGKSEGEEPTKEIEKYWSAKQHILLNPYHSVYFAYVCHPFRTNSVKEGNHFIFYSRNLK